MSVAEIATPRVVSPQPGAQSWFCSSRADFVIYGGQAGGGKSYGLLLDAARHIGNSLYRGVIFRRTTKQLTKPGQLWDQAMSLYPALGARSRAGSTLDFTFPSRSSLTLSHMEHEKNRHDWDGAQAVYWGWDQLEQFTEKQFWYVSLSRGRSDSGIRPMVRATCNPDPDSFVAELIAWWWDQDTGYAIPERSGVVRWFRRVEDKMFWYASRREALADVERTKYGAPLSLTFIAASLEDNPAMLAANPDYAARLMALSYVERERLLYGNWKIRETAGNIFKAEWFKIAPAWPRDASIALRYWDKAGTDEASATASSSRTASVLMARDFENDRYFVVDAHAGYYGDVDRERLIKQTAELDGYESRTIIEREGGSSGKDSAQWTIRHLAGYDVREDRVTGSKGVRWRPYAAQVCAGNVFLVKAPWNREFIEEHRNADPKRGNNDLVDAAAGAFTHLSREGAAGTW